MIKCRGLTFTGNTLTSGTDDGGKGKASPETAMHISACNSSVIMLNVMSGAATKTLIRDDGKHINCEIGSNPGTLR